MAHADMPAPLAGGVSWCDELEDLRPQLERRTSGHLLSLFGGLFCACHCGGESTVRPALPSGEDGLEMGRGCRGPHEDCQLCELA